MELNNCSLFDAHPKQLTECDRCSKPDNLGIQSKTATVDSFLAEYPSLIPVFGYTML